MSEQDGPHTTTKQRKIRQTSNQRDVQASLPQRPANDAKEGWKAYWKKLGQPWRLEPEIEAQRQKYFMERRSIIPDIEKSIYPFSGIKLCRADMEWLLTTHDNGLGPVNWDDEGQRNRRGLDLRGADLSHVDLSNLPLARMLSGLIWDEQPIKTDKEPGRVVVQMAGANLSGAHLEQAQLLRANLKGSRLDQAYLTKAQIHFAHLERASLGFAHLEQADCMGAYMQSTIAIAAYLEGTNLEKAHLEDSYPSRAYLADAQLSETHLAGCHLNEVFLANEMGVGPLIADLHWGDAGK